MKAFMIYHWSDRQTDRQTDRELCTSLYANAERMIKTQETRY